MSEMSVDVGLNIQADQYLQTMGQAVAITKQYTGVADGLNGRVADLNKGLVGLTERMTGFNKVNSVAVDTAAAYQKQLSGIEAKAAITNKNFAALEKTTKGFAKDFPIGIGNAVAVVESLQKSGIKAEQQISSLGKSWIRLGAATGTNAAAIGAEMLQLNKMMGNGVAQFDALADSAVGATAKIGGSVPSVIAFSKALAPVASTVGLSQTAVLGLSTAMSSLGEDGYRAANTFNKVLLDMNRSIRDGGPDLKAYADMMGMTSDALKALFKTDPSEVLTRFSEAVAKQGPAISRNLEALGFDSVRDTRALTALANAGGPRAAIQAAVGSYGSGSTAKAAEVAMEGVVDQADMLKESMSQVVANVGQPLLGIAKVQLQIANQVSGVMAGITESAPGQAVLGVAGAGGVLGSVASSALTIGAAGAGYRWLKRGITGSSAYGGLQAGRAAAMAGGVGGETVMGAGTRMERLGYIAQSAMMGLNPAGGVPGLEGEKGLTGRLARASGSLGLQGIAKYQAANANFILRELGQSPVGQTVAGQALLANSSAAMTGMMASAGRLDREGFQAAREQLREARVNARDMMRESAGRGLGRGIADVARYGAANVGAAGMMAGSMGARGLAAGAGLIGSLGMSGPMLGLIGAGAAGYMLYNRHQSGDEQMSRISDATKDVYGSFNNFAEAAGMAGKGMVSFQAQVEKTTTTLVDQNTTMERATKLSSQEINQATGMGYKPAFQITGDDRSVQSLTGQVQGVLGVNARPQEVKRALMDVANQTSVAVAEQVGANLLDASKSGGASYKGLVGNLRSQENNFFNESGLFSGPNESQGTIATQISQLGMQRSAQAGSVYGGTVKVGDTEMSAGGVAAVSEAKKMYDEALRQGVTNPGEVKGLNKALQNMLGLTDDQAITAGLGGDAFSAKGLQAGQSFDKVMERLGAYGGADGKAGSFSTYQAMRTSGMNLENPDYSRFKSGMPPAEKESRDLETAFNRITGVSNKLTDSLYGAEKAARSFGTMPGSLTAAQMSGMSAGARAQQAYEANPGDDKRLAAGRALANDAVSGANGNQSLAAFRLAVQTAMAPEGYKKEALQAATEFQQRNMALSNAGQSSMQIANQQAAVGRMAQQMPMSSNANSNTAIQSQISVGMQAEGTQRDAITQMNRAYGAMQAQIGSIRRSSGIASGAVMRDERLNEQWAGEDYRLQRQYAREDYGIARRRSNRDFGISMGRAREDFATSERYASEDYNKSRARATADFNKQQMYAEQDFNKSKTRANEDYETGRARATRDFNKQIERANRDFRLGQTRAEEDYNKSRTRSVEDFNKTVRRMVEDSAKSMYDPFKRISAQMVMDAGQLVTNLKDQTAALNKQVGNLAEARSMGLSEEAIKALSLSDAANAQQLSRLVEDMKGNASLVDQINQQVSAKATAAGSLATDQGNVSYSRMQEDFATSQARAAEDFATSQSRSSQDFSTSMSDARTDFTTTMSDSAADFTRQMSRMDDDYKTSVARSVDSFNVSMQRMDEDYATSRVRATEAFTLQMKRAVEEHDRSLKDMANDFERSQKRAEDAYEKSIERMRIKAANAVSDIGAQAGAQIQSMQEQFVAMFQSSSTDPKAAAKTLIGNLLGLGIDKKKWGDDVKAVWDAAVAQIYGSDADAAKKAGYPFFTAPTQSDYFGSAAGTYTKPYDKAPSVAGTYTKPYDIKVPAPMDIPGDPITAMAEIGAAAWEGFQHGFKDAAADGWGFFQSVWFGIVDGVKSALGIASPSKVFAEIGKNVVEGLKEGITGAISGVWELITSPIRNLDILGKVRDAFDSAKTWMGNLGSNILSWIGDAWDSTWSKVSNLNILGKVTDAFDTAKTWMGNLGDNIIEWVGTGWSKLTSGMPGLDDIKDTVTGVFASAKDWIMGLAGDSAESVSGWIGKAWHHITDNLPTVKDVLEKVTDVFGTAGKNGKGGTGVVGFFSGMIQSLTSWMPTPDQFATFFTSTFADPFKEVIKAVIRKWNSLEFTIPSDIGGIPVPGIGGRSFGMPDINLEGWALGGIAMKERAVRIAEAGYPEAVIPLNQRGAEVLASTMARYVGNYDVRSANAMQSSTQVFNNYNQSYDYRTQYTGPITVQSQDPDEMAAKLASRKRRQRLAQPIGASS